VGYGWGRAGMVGSQSEATLTQEWMKERE